MLPEFLGRGALGLGLLVREGQIVDQPARLADPRHDIVAGVNTERAGDAFHLLSVADVDPRRADVDAGHTIDAIAGAGIALLAARLSAPVSVGNGQCLGVHHRRLNARPGTHVVADLLAHETAEDEGGGGQDRDGDPGDCGGSERGKAGGQCRRIGEIEHPSPAGCDGYQQPDRPFGQPQPQLARSPRRIPETHTGVAVTLDPAFDQNEQVGPDGLRAGIAAPDAAQRRSEQKQAKPCHDQQTGDEVELVRPDLDPEEIEPPVGHIDQHRLIGQVRSAVPSDPRRDVIDAQRHTHDPPLQIAVESLHAARKDRLSRGVKRLLIGRRHRDPSGIGSVRMMGCKENAWRFLDVDQPFENEG